MRALIPKTFVKSSPKYSVELRTQAERCRFVVTRWVEMLLGSLRELCLGIVGNRQIQHLPMNLSIDLLNPLLIVLS